jgi:tetratricopeptide (TPR) repeat protein
MRVLAAIALASPLLLCAAEAGYVDSQVCARCHRQIYESFSRTGMGRSFERVEPAAWRDGEYFHPASEQHFTMYRRQGRFYQRRETNVVEMTADFVLGSGNHSRTYLHRTTDGRFLELPVGWYSENGGYWAMNPGYDRPDHLDFRRRVDNECLFCHTAYPRAAYPGAGYPGAAANPLAAIDCQRCHGPGAEHVRNPKPGSIVNPARLSPARQLEVCLQCHLESTSRRLPYAIRRYDRGAFSYRPGEPLENYIFHFDRMPGTGYEDNLEIDHAGYRLLQSACFRKSNGALTCTTCHNPHAESRNAAVYIRACIGCHAEAHRQGENCLECHMPKRRTSDAIHVTVTDHALVRRRPDRDLMAPLREIHDSALTAYRGEVVPLYPAHPAAEGELYLPAAQVTDGANLKAGIPRLRAAIEKYRPNQAEFYFELAEAYTRTGEHSSAIPFYREALARKPALAGALRGLAQTLIETGQAAEAIQILEAAPPDPATLNALGEALLRLGRIQDAVAALRHALRIEDDLLEARINLGVALYRLGDSAGAIAALREAIRLSPGSAAAHSNLASIFDARGDLEQARFHFERAIRADPASAVARYNYGRALAAAKRDAEAEAQLNEAVRLDRKLAEAWVSLGLLRARAGRREEAIAFYREALRANPELAAAHFNLGRVLLETGDALEARQHFESAIRAAPKDYEARLYLGIILLRNHEYGSAIINLQAASHNPKPEVRSAALEALRAAQSAK